jgi:hypothetical protein
VNGILKEPIKNDPVLRIVRKLTAKKSDLNLKFATNAVRKEIIDLAFIRHHRNFPPRKEKANSIGDAVNWEWIVHCANERKRDVVVVSDDRDYGDESLIQCLSDEFSIRANRNAELISALSDALKRLDIKVTTKEELGAKVIAVDKIAELPPLFWEVVLFRLAQVNPDVSKFFEESHCYLMESGKLFIWFTQPHAEHLEKLDSIDLNTVLMRIITEMGLEKKVSTIKYVKTL